MPLIDVKLPEWSYTILVESGVLGNLGAHVQSVAPHHRAVLLVDSAVTESHGLEAAASLMAAGLAPLVMPVDATEKHKSLSTVENLYRGLVKSSIERQCPLIALGGGVVGDIAGFVAATYLRGVPFIQAPTTLLAMVDASIGGKTGVNFPLSDGSLGKNLIGAFHQPRAVIADPEVLRTLKTRDFRCGLAECIKHALIADAALLDFIERNLEPVLGLDMATLTTLIERCARIKVKIVEEDEREEGRRALLNLGHTFAHVIETIPELDLRHGEAVAIGLIAAMKCAELTGRLPAADAIRVRRLLERAGLPVRLAEPVLAPTLIEAMGHDKKVMHGKLRLILPRGLGKAEIVNDVPMAVIESAWREVGAG